MLKLQGAPSATVFPPQTAADDASLNNNPPAPVPPMPQDDPSQQTMPEPPTDANQEEQEVTGKEEIQQLAGKLSQAIRDYNASLPQPDTEVNKFAAGMVISAAVDGLDSKDRKAILKKVTKGVENEDEDDVDMEETVPQENIAKE